MILRQELTDKAFILKVARMAKCSIPASQNRRYRVTSTYPLPTWATAVDALDVLEHGEQREGLIPLYHGLLNGWNTTAYGRKLQHKALSHFPFVHEDG